MIRVDTRPRHRNSPRPAWKVAKAFHQWLRSRNCAIAKNSEKWGTCFGRMEAAHTPDPQSKGIGTKAADHNAIPLCSRHHRTHTACGWSSIGLTRERAQEMAGAYWRAWDGDKGEFANG